MTETAINWGDPKLPSTFWKTVSPCPMTGCWHWTGLYKTSHHSYPSYNQKSARRFAFAAFFDLAPRQRPFNKCGDLSCCNPAHMYISKDSKRDYQMQWRDKNQARVRRNRKFNHLRKQYGIVEQQFRQMLDRQNGRCAICQLVFDDQHNKTRPRVDHCHRTGAIRELLCNACNTGVGTFQDNPEALRAAADYVERHKKAGSR